MFIVNRGSNSFLLPLTLLLLTLIILLQSPVVSAHGGLSMGEDLCMLQVGPYYMHFSGYQKSKKGKGDPKEFCEDIPALAETYIVLDFIDKVLRDMKITIRFVSNVDLSADPENDGEAIVLLPEKIYSAGSIRIMHDFTESGYFVGIVTAITPSGELLTSRFPFRVGLEAWYKGKKWWFVLFFLISIAVFIWHKTRPQKEKQLGKNRSVQDSIESL